MQSSTYFALKLLSKGEQLDNGAETFGIFNAISVPIMVACLR